MKLNTADFGRKCQFFLMMAAGSFPLPMVICANHLTGSVNACLILVGLYVILSWICLITPGKLRIPMGLVSAAGIVAASFALLPFDQLLPTLLIPIMYALLLLGGLQTCGWDPGKEVNPLVGAVSLVAHLVTQFLVNVDFRNRAEPIYAQESTPLLISFLIFGALSMLALNRASLNNAVNGRSTVPKSMRIKNRIMTGGLMAIVLLIASMPAVIKAITKVWQWIKYVLIQIVIFLLSMFPEQGSGGGGGGGMDLSALAGETSEESLLSKIITMILLVIAIAIVIVLIVIAVRIVWRKLKILFNELMRRLNAYMASASEDYVDEIADTREDADHERLMRRRKKKMLKKRVDESTLNPQERIRYRYLLHWMKHPEWTPERTVRENLNGDAAQLYERARYSSHEITEGDADAFARKLDSRKG